MTRPDLVLIIRRILVDETGATMAEYAVIASILGAAMIAGVGTLQTGAGNILTNTGTGWVNMAVTPP